MFSYAQSYASGYCVNCPESPETIVQDRREVGTTYAFAPPRIYENLITQTMVAMEDASVPKKRMFEYFLAVARDYGEDILDGKPVPFVARLKYWLGNLMVYGPLKNRYGLSKVRIGYTAGEAIGPEIFKYLPCAGDEPETALRTDRGCVYITGQPDGEIYADTVGIPMGGVEIKVADNGEVMYRSPGIFTRVLQE